MATSTRLPIPLLLLFLPLLFVSSAAHQRPPAVNPDPVKALCDATPYRDLCYQSLSFLSPLAGSGTLLARGAMNLRLDSARAASTQPSGASPDRRPLFGCVQTMGHCVTLLQQAVGQLDPLGALPAGLPGGPEYGLGIRQVQTWVGKAIADADACVTSLQHGQVVVDPAITDAVSQTLKLASNALVFVAPIATKGF